MPTNLTGSAINATYDQLLHVDDGPTATEKIVYSGTGVATALKVGTTSVGVGNLSLAGNTLSSTNTNGNLVLAPNGTGSVAISKIALTGGTISGITDLALADGGTGASTAADARTNLGLGSIATQASNNVSITGGAISGVTFTGSVPFNSITNRAYASFSDITDQTGSTTAATAVKFGTTEVTGAGITMVTDGSNLTRLTFTAAGTYMIAPNLQFANSDSNDHPATIWLALDGTNIARSATKISVPKATDGGTTFFQIAFYVTVTAGQYVQVLWKPANVAVTLDHTAAAAGPPAVPAIPSAIIIAERVA